MITQDQIQKLAADIASNFNPEKIILFGSHAYGIPHAGSDADLLVIMPFEGNPLEKMMDIVDTVHPRIACDLLVRTQSMVSKRIEMQDSFMAEILTKGKLLYERADA